jgi:chaperonin GroES
MKLRPLFDRVIIRRDDAQGKSKGGIIIPETAKDKATEGEVLAVGPGRLFHNGTMRELDVKVGDRVLVASKYTGTDFEHAGEKLLIVKEDDITAIIG